jgi:hypothetical protein
MMARRSKNGIQKALDTAAGGADSNPVTRKLRGTLPGNGPKYNGSQSDAPQVIEQMTHIENCIRAVDPRFAEAFRGKMNCAADGDQRAQEFNAMVETTAQQLYEKYTQSGVPSMAMMARIDKEMSGMNFHVSKEAAVFATEPQYSPPRNPPDVRSGQSGQDLLLRRGGIHPPTWAPRGSRSGKQR